MNRYLKKHFKIHDNKLKYDFLPSMIEIIERPANKLADFILFLVIALIATIIIWAAFWKIDIAVTATGSAMPEGGVLTLDSAYGGRISEIYVEDGSFVKEGDMILSLDCTEKQLELSESRYNLEILKVQREMYGKIYEKLCAEKETDEDLGEEEEKAIPVIDISAYEDYAYLAEAILLEHSVYEKELAYLEGEEEREAYRQQHMLGILQNINTLDVRIYSAEISLQVEEDALEQYTLRAPADGQITQMLMINEGRLVAAGDTVGYLIPKDKENLFTAYVQDEDIGQVQVGDVVSVKIVAYDDTEYEYMEGKVAYVGDITLNIEGIGAVYMVGIEIENMPEDVKIGMEGSCDIIIGTRTVLDYFVEPFKEGLHDSLKER
ncbi:MAG: HlyD family efflux transporter periplasmic adaptor subunit [Lachnospiraceae bacterium]|nr:HlyD family efflux transporter periplasmic adaptor subunit [Lachnospiraceae bacterium]